MADEFSIKVGVQLDTDYSKLDKQLNKVKDHYQKSPVKLAFGLDQVGTRSNINAALNSLITGNHISVPEITLKVNVDQKSIAAQLRNIVVDVNPSSKSSGFASGIDKITSSTIASASDISSTAEAYNKLLSVTQELYKARTRLAKLNASGKNSTNEAKNLAQTIDSLSVLQSELENSGVLSNVPTEQLNTYNSLLNELRGNYDDLTASILADEVKQVKAYQDTLSYLNVLIERSKKYKNEADDALSNGGSQSSYDAFEQHYKTLQELSSTTSTTYEEARRQVKQYTTELQAANLALDDLKKSQKNDKATKVLETNYNNLSTSIQKYLKANQNVSKNTDLYNSILKTKEAADNCDGSIEKLRAQFSAARKNAEELGLTTETLGQKLTRLFTEHFQTAVVMAGIHSVQQGLVQVYEDVVDIDTAMTELRKVTDETEASYSAFMDRSAESAQELGATVDDVIESTAEWARLGYSLEDSEELARISTMFMNVGDGIESASEAAEYLISTMKGFGLEANDAEHVLDVVNQVANTQPVSAQGLGEILTRSSAAMAAANNTFEETVALGTAMNSVLQDEDVVGTTLKTVSMYLRATSTELEEAGESTEGMAETVSDLREQLLALTDNKVDIQLDEDSYKSTYQILKEMSEAWDDMTDKEQAAATELMGGKRNSNAILALMENFEIAEASLEEAGNALGSAAQENAKYLDSIQGKLNQIRASSQVLSGDILSSDAVKNVLDLANAFIQAADGAVELVGVVPLVTTAVSGLLAASGTDGGILTPYTSLKNMLGGSFGLKEQINEITTICTKFNEEMSNSADSAALFATSIKDQNSSLSDYLKGLNGADASLGGYIKSLVTAKASTIALRVVTVALNSVISMGISFLISSAVQAIVDYSQSIQTAAENTAEAASEATNAKESLSDFISEYNGLGDRADWDTSDVETASQLQEDILELLGGQSDTMDTLLSQIDLANGKYQEQKQILSDISLEAAKNASATYNANVAAQGRALTDSAGILRTGFDVGTTFASDNTDFTDYLAEQGHRVSGQMYFTGSGDQDLSQVQALLDYYDELESAINDLAGEFDSTELAASDFYNSLVQNRDDLKDAVESYRDAVDAYNENEAIIAVGDALKETTVESKEQFDEFVDSLVDTSDGISEYEQAILDVANDAFPEFSDAAQSAASSASDAISSIAEYEAPDFDTVNDELDAIQSAYNGLSNAVSEYNEHGYLSIDTLQEIIDLDDVYLATLTEENGQLQMNANTFQTIATARLNDAKAAAVEQAIVELNAIANRSEATTAANAMTALSQKGAVVDALAGKYANLGAWAAYAAKGQALADAYSGASAVDAAAADEVMSGLNTKLGLIDSTLAGLASSAAGAGNALGGFSDASGDAADASDELTDALEEQKDAIEEQIEALEKEADKLKILGQAIIDEIGKRIDALEAQKDAQDDYFDGLIDNLEDEIDALEKAADQQNAMYDDQIEALEAQIELYEKQIEEHDKQIDALEDEIDVYDEQIEELEKKKEALEAANDEEDRAIKLAELQDALEKARNNRTVRIYQHDTGFEWAADEGAVSDAQNALDDQQREWSREDASAAIDREIDAIQEKIDAIDDEIAAIQKENDAINSQIDSINDEIDAIEKLKDAVTAECEERIAAIEAEIEAIEARKEEYDTYMQGEIDKLQALQDTYSDTMSLIGMSWEEYQAQLEAAAMASGMSYEQMAAYHSTYKDAILLNMQQIAAAETQLTAVEDQLTAANNRVSSSSGGASSGMSGLGSAATTTANELALLLEQINAQGSSLETLRAQEASLQEQLSGLTYGTIAHGTVLASLSSVQEQIAAGTSNLDSLTAQYIETLAEETNMTQTDRDMQIQMILELMDQYGVSYTAIQETLNTYVSDISNSNTRTGEEIDAIKKNLEAFAIAANTYFSDAGTSATDFSSTMTTSMGAAQSAVQSLNTSLKSLLSTINAVKSAQAGLTYANIGNVFAHNASGSQRINKSGYSYIDEEGPETIQRTSPNGKYTYLETGDTVYTASQTKALWDFSSNPSGYLHQQYDKYFKGAQGVATVQAGSNSYSTTIGDVIIQSPVGNSDELANELAKRFPNAMLQAASKR